MILTPSEFLYNLFRSEFLEIPEDLRRSMTLQALYDQMYVVGHDHISIDLDPVVLPNVT